MNKSLSLKYVGFTFDIFYCSHKLIKTVPTHKQTDRNEGNREKEGTGSFFIYRPTSSGS